MHETDTAIRSSPADSRCYENDEANCVDHGRLYRLKDVLNACPDGWRVPTEPDDVSATVSHRDVAAHRSSIWRSPVNVTYWLSVRCVSASLPRSVSP